MKKKNIMYLSYDGLLEPLGYSQILSYLKILSKKYQFWIISFEKKQDLNNKKHFENTKNILLKNNIKWSFLKFNKNSFFGILKVVDVINFFLLTIKIIKKNNIKIIHCRSYIAGLTALIVSLFLPIKIIFDMRGFWVDERIEWKIWKRKFFKYFFFKFIENQLIKKSESIVTLTHQSSKLLQIKYKKIFYKKIFVIPTFTDTKLFCIKKNTSKVNYLIHLGAIGSRYDFEKFLLLFISLKKNINIKIKIINRSEKKIIINKIKKFDINTDEYEIISSEYYQVNENLITNSIGVFFPIPGYYLNAYYPTKLGEFLSCGIPVITNEINDDVDNLIYKEKIGIILKREKKKISNNEISNIKELIIRENIDSRCREVALKYFSNTCGAKIYDKIYQKM